MAKQLAAREVESRYELDVVRFKKQQLREIKMLLAQPKLLYDGGSDRGLSDGGGSDGGGEGGLGFFDGHGYGGENPDCSQLSTPGMDLDAAYPPDAYPAGPTDAPATSASQ